MKQLGQSAKGAIGIVIVNSIQVMPLAFLKPFPDGKPRIEFWAGTGYAFGIGTAKNELLVIHLIISLKPRYTWFSDPTWVTCKSPKFNLG